MDFKQKFEQLNEREQKLTLITLVVVVIALFYGLIWSPLNQSLEQNRKAADTQQQLHSWVQKNASKALQLKRSGGGNKSFNGSLPQTVNQTASRFSISISRMQPQNDQLQVWVDQADFNSVLSWLQAMEGMGIKILDADFAHSDTQGQVKIRRLQLGKS